MIIICGNSVAEVEKDLEMMKLAIASGKPIGIGGATPSEVEKALATLKQYMDGAVAPTTNPCGGTCGCQCNGCMTDEDDEDDYPYGECPNCGEPLDEDGYCDSCGYDDNEDGYGCEDEEEETCVPDPLPSIMEMLDAMASGDLDRITAMVKRLGME